MKIYGVDFDGIDITLVIIFALCVAVIGWVLWAAWML